MIEAKYVFLLFDHRYAHINLPTMRGLKRMMVMVVRGWTVHVERQYTNANGIWQALKGFCIHMNGNFVQLRSKGTLYDN
jgi:hypothetical protein